MDEIKAPDKEVIWVRYHAVEGGRVTHVITSDLYRDFYYLYTVDEKGKLKKTRWKSHDPTELMDRIRPQK